MIADAYLTTPAPPAGIGRGEPSGVVWLEIDCRGFPRRLAVTVHGPGIPPAPGALEPLVRWFRRQRTWRGPGWAHLSIRDPEVIRRAFTEPGTIRSYHQLEVRAGLRWFFPPEWSGGILYLLDWQAHIITRLSMEFQRPARSRGPRAEK